MADIQIEEHSSPIKTPQQLIVVVLLSFIVPVAIILLLIKVITGGMDIDPAAMTEEAVAKRLKPVGELSEEADANRLEPVGEASEKAVAKRLEPAGAAGVVAKADTSASGPDAGEQLFNTVCQACHEAGVAGAPKTGDTAAWKPRIAQGIEALYSSAINGKNTMPPKGGAIKASNSDVEAAVDL
ncbi:MAG: cytochrome c5 family protein, partial [Burkholderiales bacterium]|nr:cytochrome c5 family protein [Burkholderiales bacterium]